LKELNIFKEKLFIRNKIPQKRIYLYTADLNTLYIESLIKVSKETVIVLSFSYKLYNYGA